MPKGVIDGDVGETEFRPLLPLRIGSYELVEPIGSNSRTFRARLSRDGSSYAAKMLPRLISVDQFRTLDHSNILAIIDVLEYEGKTIVISELCSGGSLEQMIEEEMLGIPSGVLKGLLRQILEGLSYLHKRGLSHGNLKPSNLLFKDSARTQLVLSDFLDGPSQLHDLDFVPPELLRQDGSSNAQAADLWQLGMVLYAGLYGRSPTSDLYRREEIALAIVNRDFTFGDGVDRDLKEVAESLLRLEPAKRPNVADLLALPVFANSRVDYRRSSFFGIPTPPSEFPPVRDIKPSASWQEKSRPRLTIPVSHGGKH